MKLAPRESTQSQEQTSADVCVSCAPGKYSISGSGRPAKATALPARLANFRSQARPR